MPPPVNPVLVTDLWDLALNPASGRPPWTVDCSLHPWLEKRRPFLGSVLAVARDGLSVSWVSGGGGGDGWNGVVLDGVWDVVENTLSPPPSPSPSGAEAVPSYVPPLAFETVLAGSGAEILTKGGEVEGAAGRGRSPRPRL